MQTDVLRVDEGDDAVQSELGADLLVHEKRLRHGSGIRKPGGFQNDAVKAVATLDELTQDADEIAPDGAADAAIVGFEDLLVRVDHQPLVHTDLAELIFDDRDAL